MPAVKSGSGGPNVPLLKVLGPTFSVLVQSGSSVALQPSRQSCTFEFAWVGKFCDGPLRPLSRSVPALATLRMISFGWSGPAELAGQRTTAGARLQRRFSLSASLAGLPLAVAFAFSVICWRFF